MVSTAANFESAMSQVQATMGMTKDSMSPVDGQFVNTMDKLNELAKKMGSETVFSAKECAEALNYLALAGYDTQQIVIRYQPHLTWQQSETLDGSIFFYISNEGVSFLENAAYLGLPVSQKIKAVLEQLHERAEDDNKEE